MTSPPSLSSEVASWMSAHVTSFLQWALCLESGRGLNVLQARSVQWPRACRSFRGKLESLIFQLKGHRQGLPP